MSRRPIHSDQEIRTAINDAGGSTAGAAKALGVNIRTIQRRLAAMPQGIIDAPIVRQSTLTNLSTGEDLLQWNIRATQRTEEAERALIQATAADIVALPPRALIDKPRTDVLANEFVFSDVHIGQMADAESEEDLEFQFELISKAFSHLIANSEPAQTAILVILGDWFHFDNLLPLTPRSQNVLFANGNYRDMVEIGVKLMRRMIDWCLMSHEHVELVICEGNHDQASAQWLKIMMMALYEQEERLKIADSDTPFYAIPFGRTFLGYHHGHIKGLRDTRDLALYFASKYREMWGQTKHTFLNTGHFHHVHEKEEHGVMIRQHPTLASKDHYSHQHGYRSVTAAYCTTYSRHYGEVGTQRVTKEMLM